MSERSFNRFASFIQTRCGIRMPREKRVMLECRLRSRLRALGMASFEEYADAVLGAGDERGELANLIDVVTTNKTEFFREPVHFDFLLRSALPDLAAAGRVSGGGLRVWSAGCSTGEEVYTLAMVLAGETEGRPRGFDIQGTDLSRRVLDTAREAVYAETRIEGIPQNLRRRWLMRSRDRGRALVRFVPELRERTSFRHLNLLDGSYDLGAFHVIFCRNVMIYFDRPTQIEGMRRICRHLIPGGYLFIGHAESLYAVDPGLAAVAPAVYRKAGQ